MNQKQLIGAIAVAVVIVNVLGFVAYRATRSAPIGAVTSAPVAPPVVAAPRNDELEAEQNARARRAAGVAALEAGEYDKALINFTEARALAGDKAKVDDLLKITEDLRNRAVEKAAPVEAPAPPPVVAKPGPVRPSRAVAPVAPPKVAAVERRVEPKPTEAPAPVAVGSGMLLVSTTPRGLLVQVDGQPMDLTPMRAPVKVGSHRVALIDGDRKIYETTVEVLDGQVATVLRDLTVELAPREAARPEPKPEPKVEPKPEAKVEPKNPPKTEVARVEPSVVTPTPVVLPGPATKGGLELTSPGLYGEIWVNGRPAGFPPVTVEGLAAGPVKVEVRVNGAVKRSTTAIVEAGQLKAVRVVR